MADIYHGMRCRTPYIRHVACEYGFEKANTAILFGPHYSSTEHLLIKMAFALIQV